LRLKGNNQAVQVLARVREGMVMAEDDFSTIPTAEPCAVDELIERWWVDHFPGSPIARDTQAWNVAYAAKEILKRLLKGIV
jgi:hypothetical protein